MRAKRTTDVLLALALWVAISAIDNQVTYEIGLSIFYLIPISFAVYRLGFAAGLTVSVLSSLSWYFNDLGTGHTYSNPLMPLWNALMRYGYFVLHSYFLSRYSLLLKKSQQQAYTDSLTNARNSRYLIEQIRRDHDHAAAQNKPLTLAYIDLDNFKAVNDTKGHAEGDLVLQTLANCTMALMGEKDTFGRMGGDEFVLILPGYTFDEANTLLTRLRSAVHAEFAAHNWPVSLSVGAITYTELGRLADRLLQDVDSLMYAVKKSGKDALRHEPRP
ncbi:GGDEF domain-containing protein [Turneriella parva]|uniref:diguanylate cyclase n=1 Tax=Turneriella parva (strain ATCC BAA-1111 / DSM 21527 / NCTC 11395 / H) TaxID=869212 RepID=I4B3H9_TURPD|nr:GGDEF domain-containing protein [Turneriella parva]AFM11836.1 diguanylate cyclase [Turneriella parva DSM 21527]